MARKPMGPKMVENMDGSKQAKKKLKVILETVSGQKSVREACEELGIGEARFHELRKEILQSALEASEPGRAGRPRKATEEENQEIAELKDEIKELRIDLQAARVREEIAAVMPQILKPLKPGEKKTPQDLFGRKRGTSRDSK